VATSSAPCDLTLGDGLLLRETNHRWCNDLQLVVGLLALQGKRATNPEVRQALTEAMDRVSILSHARSAMFRECQTSLGTALECVCEALHGHADPRSISIILDLGQEVEGLSDRQITAIALVVNELATNAIKHAFKEGQPGQVRMSVRRPAGCEVIIAVEDDGAPFAEVARGHGLGAELVRRLMASIGGVLIPPPSGTKRFELRVPLQS
jgi:two-component sensor histidine kinase